MGIIRTKPKKGKIMSRPNAGHRFLFTFCMVIVVAFGGALAIDIFMSGLRIMLFGMKLVLVPAILLAAVYVAWHVGRFFGRR